jgi:hypothetical protein
MVFDVWLRGDCQTFATVLLATLQGKKEEEEEEEEAEEEEKEEEKETTVAIELVPLAAHLYQF